MSRDRSRGREDERGERGELWPFSRDEHGRLCYRGEPLPAGPWHAEPDRLELEHGGIACLLLRGPMGAWCGYVGLPVDHPWAHLDLIASPHPAEPWPDDAPEITYQRARPPTGMPSARTDGYEQWIGFSCASPGGSTLEIRALLGGDVPPGDYRDLAHAEREIRCLAGLVLAALPN